ncbi:MAG: 2OG-Fe(II) oxygenase [Methylophilus sp.]|nr:2OG-Fe(II) oxygenase [Methylophilus sp.]
MSSVLPIQMQDGGLLLDKKGVESIGRGLNQAYNSAHPFPHIALDDFLPELLVSEILNNFPYESVESEVNFEMGYAGQHKRQIPPIHCNAFNRNLFAFFNSEPMLKFLESLTGIEKLIPDPYFAGGGYHETSKGGLLGIHADFRINKELNLNRRINMIIYLNENWEEQWGGALELWDKSMESVQRKVLPILNRCVIFNTDQDSFHGHPDPLTCPENVTRKSIALYYYTASENVFLETPAHDTMYKARPTDSSRTKYDAFMSSLGNYVSDWLPPIMARQYFKIRYFLHRKFNRT